jgi:hypothetical protein
MSTEVADVIKVLAGILTGGGGIWAWLTSREGKKKTPYDMMVEMLEEQRKFYHERNADYERERLDSAEKSAVIQQTHKCRLKYTNPDAACPVDAANEERLKNRCDRCGYGNKEEEK